MKTLKSLITTVLAFIVLLWLFPVIAALSPLLVLFLFFFGFARLKSVSRNIWQGLQSLLSSCLNGVIGLLQGLFGLLAWLYGKRPTKQSNGFMSGWSRWRKFGSHQDGFLVDGNRQRLSETATYESLLIQGGMGRGKTSTFMIPNLLRLPKHRPSFVVTDTSGEVLQNTAGYLTQQGYAIQCLDLIDLTRSENYNPLARCQSSRDIAELAKTLVLTANHQPGGRRGDPFWEQSAEKLIRILAQCLHNQPNPDLRNLANLRHLITSFDAHTAPNGQLGKIDHFVLNATQNDLSTFASYQAFVQGNLKTIQSVLMSADVALDPLGIPELASLTATNSINFADLRGQPTALYILVNQTQMPFYAFLLNLFFSDLFKSLLTNSHNPGRPVWLFLEEFGHLTVNNFETYATTARKYKVGFAMFLQSLAQLEARYGAINTKTITEAIGTEIYLPGMALDTARNLEARLGRMGHGQGQATPLMPAHDIIRMKKQRALMLPSNHRPVLLKTKRFYQQAALSRRSSVPFSGPPSQPKLPPKLIQL
ncbi:MAG: type IV secretory system conjugative DNA transfer family protein [Pseudomonadota bacterium]